MQCVRALAFVELTEPARSEHWVADPIEDEVRAYQAPVLAQRLGETVGSRVGVHPCQQDARDDPAALDRAGEAHQLLPLASDHVIADLAGEQHVGCQVRLAGPEAVERRVGDVVQARDEPPAKQIEAREHQLRRPMGVGRVDLGCVVGEDDRVEGVQALAFGDGDDLAAEVGLRPQVCVSQQLALVAVPLVVV